MLVFQGDEANLRILAEEIARHPDLGAACTVGISAGPDRQPGTLGHGVVAEIAVAVVSGVLTATLSDAMKVLIARARDRGKVTEVNGGDAGRGGQAKQ